jgi:VWFA-related protein
MTLIMRLRPALLFMSFISLASMPLVSQQGNEPQATVPTIEMNVNRVLVPVVVRDKKGQTVDDLKKEDFQVFDNDKLRPLSGFTVERYGLPETNTAMNQGDGQQTSVPPSATMPQRIIVFLFDDMHLGFEDLSYAQKATVRALDEALTGSDIVAVVSTSGRINSGLTRDRAKLQDAIMAVRPQGVYRSDASECPKIDYYQADLIEDKHDSAALQDAIRQIMTVCNPNTPSDLAERTAHAAAMRVLIVGNQDLQATYGATAEFVHRIAKMPGQHTLILVSSGFLPIEEESRVLESRLIDLATQSDVTISAIDARGLYTASVSASDDTRGRSPGQVSEYRRSAMKLEENAMGELADGTGGVFFHNSNDLDAGLRSLTQDPKTVYMLELSLDNIKPDGSYHRLKVKLDRDGLDLKARRGYSIPKPGKNKK